MIHPAAIVHPGAKLAPDVSVGPYSIIGERVEIGEGTSIGPHVVIEGRTRIGAQNRIFAFSSLGGPPQDTKYAGEPTALEIGDRGGMQAGPLGNIPLGQPAGKTSVTEDQSKLSNVH